MYCTKCGTEVSESANYCPRCGEKLEEKISLEENRIGEIVYSCGSTDKLWVVFGKLSKIFGIIALALCWLPYFLGLVFGLPAIVLGGMARRKSAYQKTRRNASVGIGLAIPAFIISSLVFFVFIVFVALKIAGIVDWELSWF